MHEIITLQLGSQANYLGTHFWNAQESYFTYSESEESLVDHDIHFRAGQGTDGSETFTPRTVIYDFKTEFGALRRINELYDVVGEQAESNAWGTTTHTYRQPAIAPSPYQTALNSFEDPAPPTLSTVRYWSDTSKIFYHPRSLVPIHETELPPADRAFTSWATGLELFDQLSKDEDLVERDVRPAAEESDQMQGVQVWCESESAWAGFASKMVEGLRDEFGKMPIWVVGLEGVGRGGDEITARTNRQINHARSLHYTASQASMYLPLTASPSASQSPDYITLERTHPWHTSALQCTALESALLPSRLKASSGLPQTTLDHLALQITGGEDQRVARLAFNIDGTTRKSELTNGHAHAADASTGNGISDSRAPSRTSAPALARAKTQSCDIFPVLPMSTPQHHEDHTFRNTIIHRGPQTEAPASQSAEDETPTHTYITPLRFPLPTSFPHIYSLAAGSSTSSCAVNASMHITSSIGDWVRGLERVTSRATSVDEREELRDGLRSIAEGYHWGFESDGEEEGGGDDYE